MNPFLSAQTYYAWGGAGGNTFYEITLPSDCEPNGCTLTAIGFIDDFSCSFCPNGNLYGEIYPGSDIYQIDPATGNSSLIFNSTSGVEIRGLVCSQDSLLYTLSWPNLELYVYNINSGTLTLIGPTNFYQWSYDLAFFEGEFYFSVLEGIVRLDVIDPSNSALVVTWPTNEYHLLGLTASSVCHTLIGLDNNSDQLLAINLVDGSITPICTIPELLTRIFSFNEYLTPTCEVYLDLDCNDSSGALEADYNSPDFDCLSDPVEIADEDIKILIDASITEMTIELIAPLPDDPNEILIMTGGVPGITVSGGGTTMITFTNAGGAKIQDFKDALHYVFYNNTSLYPTNGLRTVEVQFTTASGAMSNIASAYIQVNELLLINVDLGPDQERCDGETATFNAGNPGANYQWSNGPTSQSITVGNGGQYIVTVSNGVNCPNQDTVMLDILPVIHVSLTGDAEICDNEQANLTITTDAPFPITVEIDIDPGASLTFTEVIGNYNFFVAPDGYTEYTITNVIPSQDACIEITDPFHNVEVYSTYENDAQISLCDGDSIWLGYYWETEAGDYVIIYNSIEGCDSTVNFTIEILPAANVSINATTCNPAEVGIFVTHIDNPIGCDTIVETTVSLLPSDTTFLSASDCNASDTGLFQQVLTNLAGCDSIVITNVDYTLNPYIYIDALTCDSSLLGISQQLYMDQSGCDSIVITTVGMMPSDTSYVFGISCDPANIGVFENLLSNQSGCDSLVIFTVTAGIPDTTYLNTTSCDSASLGVFEEHFNSQSGCDSTVFTTITYSASDSTFIQSASCDPLDVGVFIQNLVNRFGCDSIVTTMVELMPTNDIYLTSTTCDTTEAGVFVDTLNNQFGCDSFVTETVELLPSDETFLFSTSCMSSEAGMFITTHLNQYGCDSTVTLTVSLVPADTTVLSFKTCDPTQVGNIENTFTNIDGCDSLVIEQTTLYPIPELQLSVTSDYNGYAISCFGESDGSTNADITGIPPWTYIWSTGDDEQMLTGLSAGAYAVTVTDGNGCTTSGEIMLFEPEEFSISFIVSQPDCFDHQDGSLTVEQSGGIEPIRYSLDEVNYQSSPVFDQLSGGTYTVTAIDANDCEVKEIIWINVPLMVHVELPDDQMAFPGDTVIINAIVNVPYDSLASVVWSGLNNSACPTCMSQPVAPIITTTYSVTVTSLDGCMDEDAMTLFLERNDDVYVPNIFSPNGDGLNDALYISAGSQVEEISSFIIFDRWGNVVFADQHFQPNNASRAWDGRFKGRELNPGVFAFRMIVEFLDGVQDVIYGDVTLIR